MISVWAWLTFVLSLPAAAAISLAVDHLHKRWEARMELLERLADPTPLPGEMPRAEAERLVAAYDLGLWDTELSQPDEPMPGPDMPLRQPWDGAE